MDSEVFDAFLSAFRAILTGINQMVGTGNSGLISCIKSFVTTVANTPFLLAFVLITLVGLGIGLVRRCMD